MTMPATSPTDPLRRWQPVLWSILVIATILLAVDGYQRCSYARDMHLGQDAAVQP